MRGIKTTLRDNRSVNRAYTIYRTRVTRAKYLKLQAHYQGYAAEHSLIYSEEQNREKLEGSLCSRGLQIEPAQKGALRIVFAGVDHGQDYGGILQGLGKFGEVIPFTRDAGEYGQELPGAKKRETAVENGRRLIDIVEGASREGPVHAVIGQMWERSMSGDALNTIRYMGIPVVNISMDDRHAFKKNRRRGSFGGTKGLIGAIDLACTAARECCLWYQIEGCPALYFPEASDPEMYGPMPVDKEHDVVFVGMNYGIRSDIIATIEKAGIKTTCYGNGWPNGRIDLKDIPGLFAGSRIVLGIGTIGNCADFFALKMRDFDGPMSGSLYVTHDNPDLYDFFEVGKEIVTYRSRKDLAEKLAYYLKHVDEAEEIAIAGRRRAEGEHTWEMRFDKLLRFCGLLA